MKNVYTLSKQQRHTRWKQQVGRDKLIQMKKLNNKYNEGRKEGKNKFYIHTFLT